MNDAIIVTGGAGFIGGNYVRARLAAGGEQVVNLDLLTYAGNIETLSDVMEHPDHRFVQGDIGDRGLVGHLLDKYEPRAVVNFAAESHVDRAIDGPGAFIQTNVVGTSNLLETVRAYWTRLPAAERSGFRFLHVSTDEVYGSLGAKGCFCEESCYRPNSPYSASKAASDHLVRAYFHTYGLPTLTTNCSNNYGPYQYPEKLIPRMILNALEGSSLPIYGKGTNVRDWLFVADHCRAIDRVLEAGRPGEVYNIGGDAERTNLEVVQSLCRLLDEMNPGGAPHERLIEFVADRPGHDLRYAIDASKLRVELGWSPEEDFDSGLRRTVRWYLDELEWCRRVQENSYDGRRLGLGTTEIGV